MTSRMRVEDGWQYLVEGCDYDPGIGVDDTVSQKASFRWESQSKRDEGYFETAWFADFRKRWQDDLYRERLNFQARLEAI